MSLYTRCTDRQEMSVLGKNFSGRSIAVRLIHLAESHFANNSNVLGR